MRRPSGKLYSLVRDYLACVPSLGASSSSGLVCRKGLLKNILNTGKGYMELRQKYETKCCIPYTGMLYLWQRSIEVNITISEKHRGISGKGDCGKSRFVIDTELCREPGYARNTENLILM